MKDIQIQKYEQALLHAIGSLSSIKIKHGLNIADLGHEQSGVNVLNQIPWRTLNLKESPPNAQLKAL